MRGFVRAQDVADHVAAAHGSQADLAYHWRVLAEVVAVVVPEFRPYCVDPDLDSTAQVAILEPPVAGVDVSPAPPNVSRCRKDDTYIGRRNSTYLQAPTSSSLLHPLALYKQGTPSTFCTSLMK